jgi:hypothetical protein
MEHTETHEMTLLHVEETGEEEWYCPNCGRRFLMTWPPEYTKKVLVPGDVSATHLGGKGGLHMGEPTVLDVDTYLPEPEPAPAPPPEPSLDDALLAPWRRAIDQIDPE